MLRLYQTVLQLKDDAPIASGGQEHEAVFQARGKQIPGEMGHAHMPQARVCYDRDNLVTILQVGSPEGFQPVGTIPYLVDHVTELWPHLLKVAPGIDILREQLVLSNHVEQVVATGGSCRMERRMPEIQEVMCQAAVLCEYRVFNPQRQVPCCHRNKAVR